jgi:hypothetical protein
MRYLRDARIYILILAVFWAFFSICFFSLCFDENQSKSYLSIFSKEKVSSQTLQEQDNFFIYMFGKKILWKAQESLTHMALWANASVTLFGILVVLINLLTSNDIFASRLLGVAFGILVVVVVFSLINYAAFDESMHASIIQLSFYFCIILSILDLLLFFRMKYNKKYRNQSRTTAENEQLDLDIHDMHQTIFYVDLPALVLVFLMYIVVEKPNMHEFIFGMDVAAMCAFNFTFIMIYMTTLFNPTLPRTIYVAIVQMFRNSHRLIIWRRR